VDGIQLLVAWPICAQSERRLLRESALYSPWLPIYRMVIYLFRMSGILRTLSEKPQWTASAGWMELVRLPGSDQAGNWIRRVVRVWAE
jgi:hypothetical protein